MGLDILLLDNDPNWTHIASIMYGRSNRITAFRQGQEALDSITTNQKDYGLVITGYKIGSMDGDAFFYSTKEFYSKQPHRDIPFFIMYTEYKEIVQQFNDPKEEGIVGVAKNDQELMSHHIAKINQGIKEADWLTTRSYSHRKQGRYALKLNQWQQLLQHMQSLRQMYEAETENLAERKINHWKALRGMNRWMLHKDTFPKYVEMVETFTELCAWYEQVREVNP